MLKMIKKLSYARIAALSFLCIIALGTVLLILPFATKAGQDTSFINALFTSVSATCVTGLSPYDVFSHWTIFGQLVILVLIQVGGLGFMSMVSFISMFTKRKISVGERKILMQSAGSNRMDGVMTLMKQILRGTFLFEGIGIILLCFRFIPQYGFGTGLYYSIFHSISAFCNAGFDLMGRIVPGSSFESYVSDPYVCIVLMCLIIIGGIGFIVWQDISEHKFDFKHYRLHSKIVLTTTGILLVFGFVAFFITEYNNAYKELSLPDKLLAALFQSVTTRTAGFATVNQAELSTTGNFITIVLMLIGGSSGSTAGGLKTTTLAAIFLDTISNARNHDATTIFKRRLSAKTVRQAHSVFTFYMIVVVVSLIVISFLEPFSLSQLLFEICSALGTVGLSTGITAQLGGLTKLILCLLMYAGRLGGLSIAMAVAETHSEPGLYRPTEDIMVG